MITPMEFVAPTMIVSVQFGSSVQVLPQQVL
jgi:hypothetical protein